MSSSIGFGKMDEFALYLVGFESSLPEPFMGCFKGCLHDLSGLLSGVGCHGDRPIINIQGVGEKG